MTNCAGFKNICCLALSLQLPGRVYFPGSDEYKTSLGSYFAIQASDVQPHCIVSPQTTQQVSKAVQVLTTSNSTDGSSGCRFAIRSGGHASSAMAANIQDGITIDLSALNTIVLGQGPRPVTSAGVGAKWGEIYALLDPVHLSVNGARAASVGVGGLITGGGISYFGTRYGWACDTVTNFEVVLGNGSIINANTHENEDLLWALRGGTNNFGIITQVDLQTFEQGDLWGGFAAHSISTTEQINALAEFSDPATYDDFAALITSFVYSGAQGFSLIVNNMEYTKPEANPPVFRSLLGLQPLFSTQRITNMTDLAIETALSDPSGQRQTRAAFTIKATVEAINAAVRAWNASLPLVQHIPGIVWSVVMDPLPPSLYARNSGANALGFDDDRDRNVSLIVVQFYASWSAAGDDQTIDMAAEVLIDTIQRDVGNLGALDRFIYANYAGPWQDPMAGYGEASVKRLREVKRKYDPDDVFTRLVPGGFKLL